MQSHNAVMVVAGYCGEICDNFGYSHRSEKSKELLRLSLRIGD